MGFRENLKSELDYSGMLIKELANLSGVKKKTIESYLGTHSYMPSADTAVAIAQALGVSVEYLVTGKDVKLKTVHYPLEAKLAADITAQMEERNRKMAVAIIKTIKKQEDEEKK